MTGGGFDFAELGRDCLFAAGALLFTKTRRSFPPSVWGKLSTIAQMGFVVAVVLDLAGFTLPVAFLGWVTAGVTVVSALDYARRAMRPSFGRPGETSSPGQ